MSFIAVQTFKSTSSNDDVSWTKDSADNVRIFEAEE